MKSAINTLVDELIKLDKDWELVEYDFVRNTTNSSALLYSRHWRMFIVVEGYVQDDTMYIKSYLYYVFSSDRLYPLEPMLTRLSKHMYIECGLHVVPTKVKKKKLRWYNRGKFYSLVKKEGATY
ncbi:hypothetical protein CEW46_27545 [Bacillus cereus]|nr:hypothetical protein CEW46_27545 [Bacillus cereus]